MRGAHPRNIQDICETSSERTWLKKCLWAPLVKILDPPLNHEWLVGHVVEAIQKLDIGYSQFKFIPRL